MNALLNGALEGSFVGIQCRKGVIGHHNASRAKWDTQGRPGRDAGACITAASQEPGALAEPAANAAKLCRVPLSTIGAFT